MNKVSRTQLARNFVRLLDEHPKHQLVQALAQALIDQKMTNQIDLLTRDINSQLLAHSGQLDVEVTSAHEMREEVLEALTHLLKQHTGANSISYSHKIEKKLLGGLRATTPELEIDLSVRSKLNKLGAL